MGDPLCRATNSATIIRPLSTSATETRERARRERRSFNDAGREGGKLGVGVPGRLARGEAAKDKEFREIDRTETCSHCQRRGATDEEEEEEARAREEYLRNSLE